MLLFWFLVLIIISLQADLSLCSPRCAPSSGPPWKTQRSHWIGAQAAPDPLYQQEIFSQRFIMLRQNLGACNMSWLWETSVGQGWEVQQNCKQVGNYTFRKGKICFLFADDRFSSNSHLQRFSFHPLQHFWHEHIQGLYAVKWIARVMRVWALTHVCHAQTNTQTKDPQRIFPS